MVTVISMIGRSASETLALLTVACDVYAMKKSGVLSGIGGSGKDENVCKMAQEVGRPERKGQIQMWTEDEQTVNQQCYLEVLTRLQKSVRRKRPELWPDKWILHHDSAPVHDSLRVREFLAKKSIAEVDHPPYSPDLDPYDFWLFPKLKHFPEGTKIS
jgi:hypothetical protein